MKDTDTIVRALCDLLAQATTTAEAAERDGESLSRHALEIDGDPAYSFEQVNTAAGEAQAARYKGELLRDRAKKIAEAISLLEESEEILRKHGG